jgi:hypothetical protein
MTAGPNRSSMIAVESGLSKELSGTIKSSNDQKVKDNLALIQEDDKERLDSVPNGGNYESIKKDNEIQYASLSKNLEYMRISKRM